MLNRSTNTYIQAFYLSYIFKIVSVLNLIEKFMFTKFKYEFFSENFIVISSNILTYSTTSTLSVPEVQNGNNNNNQNFEPQHAPIINRNQNVLTHTSHLYTVHQVPCKIISKIGKFTLDNFVYYSTSFKSNFPFRINSVTSLDFHFHLLRTYISMYLLNNSDYILNLFQSSFNVNAPAFVHTYIQTISMQVESINKSVGVTYGKSQVLDTIDSILSFIKLDLSSKNSQIIKAFKQSGIINTTDNRFVDIQADSLLEKFKSIDLRCTNTFIFEPFYLIKQYIPGESYVPIICNVKYSYNKALGIYRFRAGNSSKTSYLVSQNTASSISASTMNLFCFYLAIYNPAYFINNVPAPSIPVGQEAELIFDGIDKNLIFDSLFTIRHFSSIPVNNIQILNNTRGAQPNGNQRREYSTSTHQLSQSPAILQKSINSNYVGLHNEEKHVYMKWYSTTGQVVTFYNSADNFIDIYKVALAT